MLLSCIGCSRDNTQPQSSSSTEQKKGLKLQPAPTTLFKKHLFDVFDVITTSLGRIDFAPADEKARAEAKTISVVKDYIAKELKDNPKALYAEGEYGLTPAHQLLLDCLFYTRRLYWAGTDPGIISDPGLVKRVVIKVFEELRTEKKVRAYKPWWWSSEGRLFSYLQTLGMDKTALSADEMKKAWGAIDPNGVF